MAKKKKENKTKAMTQEELDALDRVPLRVLCVKKELDYWLKSDRGVADKLEMLQSIVNNLRIYDYGKKTQKVCQELFKQGVLYDHTKAALEDDDENPWSKRKRSKKEIMEEPVKGKKKEEKDIGWFQRNFIAPKEKEKKEKKDV